MQSVVHVVTTGNFAGVERYVCDVARETAQRGWNVTVVGGREEWMPSALGESVRWLPGATPGEALKSMRRSGRQNICHAHMTRAEAVAIVARLLHRAPIVSTRHFAAPRGKTRAGRLLAPRIAKRLARQIAASEFVAQHLERPPDAVILNGVPPSPCLWQASSRIVLVLQRLEREKDTVTALRAWSASKLHQEGWSLRVVGGGSERTALDELVSSMGIPGVEFVGPTARVDREFASAGMLLTAATAEPFGLVVVEAMAAGVPVVASDAGGHRETIGIVPNAAMFSAGSPDEAAVSLRSLLPDQAREGASTAGREVVDQHFRIGHHVDRLLAEYERARPHATRPTGSEAESG